MSAHAVEPLIEFDAATEAEIREALQIKCEIALRQWIDGHPEDTHCDEPAAWLLTLQCTACGYTRPAAVCAEHAHSNLVCFACNQGDLICTEVVKI